MINNYTSHSSSFRCSLVFSDFFLYFSISFVLLSSILWIALVFLSFNTWFLKYNSSSRLSFILISLKLSFFSHLVSSSDSVSLSSLSLVEKNYNSQMLSSLFYCNKLKLISDTWGIKSSLFRSSKYSGIYSFMYFLLASIYSEIGF